MLDEQFEAKTKVPKKEEKEEKSTLHSKACKLMYNT